MITPFAPPRGLTRRSPPAISSPAHVGAGIGVDPSDRHRARRGHGDRGLEDRRQPSEEGYEELALGLTREGASAVSRPLVELARDDWSGRGTCGATLGELRVEQQRPFASVEITSDSASEAA